MTTKKPSKKTVSKRKKTIAKKASPRTQKKQPWEQTYKSEFAMVAYELALLGFGPKRIAKVFCVPVNHVNKWKENIEEFRACFASGSEMADAKVAKALFQRAIGYTHDEEKIHFNKLGEVSTYETKKHYPPDTAAAKLWLELRQKDLWKSENDLNLNLNEMIPWSSVKSGVDE